jgi:hypothetical protein
MGNHRSTNPNNGLAQQAVQEVKQEQAGQRGKKKGRYSYNNNKKNNNKRQG